VAFGLVVLLGTIGFTRLQEETGGVEPLASRIYASFQLFAMEGGAVPGPVPWELEVARYAAPLVVAWAVVGALAVVFRDQIESLRLRTVHDHVVVAGLGRKGGLLAHALLAAGRRVVVIEADGANDALGAMRANGAFAVVGDARRADVLRRARVLHASHLVVLCGADVVNAEVFACAREIAAERPGGTLQCVVHLVDPELCLLLRGEELERYGRSPVRVDFVNTYAAGAEALVRLHPPWTLEATGESGSPRIVVHGAGPMARHCLVALARAWATSRPTPEPSAPPRRLPVHVVGLGRATLRELADRHVEIARFLAMRAEEDLVEAVDDTQPSLLYVCPDDDSAAAAAALRLRTLLHGRQARIVVVLGQRAGIGHLLADAPQPPGGPELVTFGLLDEACQPELLLAGTTELLARALHRSYVGAHVGATSEDDPTIRPWAELPEPFRESNRDQAAHVAVKLAAIGQAIGPLVDWDEARRPFSPAEVETMARLEHDRWSAERRRSGWRAGIRDPIHHITPYLVPWEQLPEEVREQDRVFVRQLPEILTSVGLQARREIRRRGRDTHQPAVKEATHAPARASWTTR
jgi:hypothetical protein